MIPRLLKPNGVLRGGRRWFSQGRSKAGAVTKEKTTKLKDDLGTISNSGANDVVMEKENQVDEVNEKCQSKAGSLRDESLRPTLLVPNVSPTDHLAPNEVHLEGLFAGFKPLFLGNSATIKPNVDFIDNGYFISKNFKVVGASTDGDNPEKSLEKFLDTLKNTEWELEEDSPKKIIPWEASISGIEYNDKSFKNVPKNVIGRLKPFKLLRMKINNKNKSGGKKRSTIIKQLKFNNSKVNDEMHLIDLFNKPNHTNIRGSRSGDMSGLGMQNLTKEQILKRKEHFKEVMYFYHKYSFLKKDCDQYKIQVEKFSRLAQREFQKVTGLVIRPRRGDYSVPLHAYINRKQCSKKILERYFRKRIYQDVTSILLTFSSTIKDDLAMKRFRRKLHRLQENTIQDLLSTIPSAEFQESDSDCLICRSPVVGFNRLHWLKPSKRWNTIRGTNISREYNYSSGVYSITRSGMKYMRYPVYLNWNTYDATFKSWNHYNG
ncbi:hypothetical protein RNJ44_05060 [Nakaseomyces bracarensis]|uniref:Uncharacterized protein n=1 Tax=Nakaseomyces bracarensis TaxID=273131 RepID=A0ABR4NWM3_9SACH